MQNDFLCNGTEYCRRLRKRAFPLPAFPPENLTVSLHASAKFAGARMGRGIFPRPFFVLFGRCNMSLIEIRDLTFSYDGSPRPVFENLSLRIDTDWKLGLIGRNGRGKTTFLRLPAGQYEYRETIAAAVKFVCFPFAAGEERRTTLAVLREACPDAEEWRIERELSRLFGGTEEKSTHRRQPLRARAPVRLGRTAEFHRHRFPHTDRKFAAYLRPDNDLCGT